MARVRTIAIARAGHKSTGEPVQEELLVDRLEDGSFVLVATPALVLGVAAEDRIRVDDNGVVTVLERAGNLAVQVFADHDATAPLISEFEKVGGRVDAKAKGLTVITVPVSVGFPRVEALLRDFSSVTPGSEWYYGNVYAEDGVTPLNWWI